MKICNPNINTFNLDTYMYIDWYNKVYAAGFYTVDNINIYYIYKDIKDYHNIILKYINIILIPKYNKYIFYTHTDNMVTYKKLD